MAADVSSLIKAMHRDDSETDNSRDVITRDLLSGSFKNHSQELDIDMEVPPGWEKHLDLKSGRVYIKRCNNNTPIASLPSLDKKPQTNHAVPIKLHDLNFPTSPRKPLLNLLDDNDLELKLASRTSSPQCLHNYQSICTLDKVKYALEKAEKQSIKKRSSSSPSHSSSSSSIRDIHEDDHDADNTNKPLNFPVATGCPRCLFYVLVSRSEPKCPQCNMAVPLPPTKKNRIDLNISI